MHGMGSNRRVDGPYPRSHARWRFEEGVLLLARPERAPGEECRALGLLRFRPPICPCVCPLLWQWLGRCCALVRSRWDGAPRREPGRAPGGVGAPEVPVEALAGGCA